MKRIYNLVSLVIIAFVYLSGFNIGLSFTFEQYALRYFNPVSYVLFFLFTFIYGFISWKYPTRLFVLSRTKLKNNGQAKHHYNKSPKVITMLGGIYLASSLVACIYFLLNFYLGSSMNESFCSNFNAILQLVLSCDIAMLVVVTSFPQILNNALGGLLTIPFLLELIQVFFPKLDNSLLAISQRLYS